MVKILDPFSLVATSLVDSNHFKDVLVPAFKKKTDVSVPYIYKREVEFFLFFPFHSGAGRNIRHRFQVRTTGQAPHRAFVHNIYMLAVQHKLGQDRWANLVNWLFIQTRRRSVGSLVNSYLLLNNVHAYCKMSQSSTTKIIPSRFLKWCVVRSTACKGTSAARWSKCKILRSTSDVGV